MFVLGLTGSAAMGKSTAAIAFRRLGVPVFDADATVHELLGPRGAAVGVVRAAFPDVITDEQVDRAALGARVFGDEPALRRLESILHPMVIAERNAFVKRMRRADRRMVVLDIPLLFETGAEKICDAVAVVSAPAFIQMQRLLARPGIDRGRAEAILASQMPDSEKRRRAHVIIPTGLGKATAFAVIGRIVRDCRCGCFSRTLWRRTVRVDEAREVT